MVFNQAMGGASAAQVSNALAHEVTTPGQAPQVQANDVSQYEAQGYTPTQAANLASGLSASGAALGGTGQAAARAAGTAGAGSASDTSALDALLAAQTAANNAAAQQANESALLTIEQTLASYGFSGNALSQLVSFAWSEIQQGTPAAQVALNIQNQDAFIQQFPAISERIANGLPPITPAEYLSTLDSYTQTLVAAGINPSSVNLNQLVALDVSPTELSDRVQQGYLAVAMAPQDVINAMQQYYGVSKGQLASYFLNPSENEAKLLQQATAAQIGGAATGSGFMGANAQSTTSPISQSLALQLAQQGVTYGQAQTGFAQLANEAQLYGQLPGQGQVRGNGGAPYTASQLAEAQFFGGPAEQQLQQQATREENYFKQGTNVGTSGTQTAVGAFQR